jgi:glycerol-3-phosphate dehydrogenase subunit B
MKAQAAYDVIVVGAGLAGMFAGALAARGGARTLVIARGQGGTHLGPGCVDVFGYAPAASAPAARAVVDSPAQAVKQLAAEHPLSRAGEAALSAALAEFQKINAEAGYAWVGQVERNFKLPSAMGAARPTCLAPQSYAAGDLSRSDELTLARLAGFRDFYADLAVANLQAAGYAARAVALEVPNAPRRDAFATDLARRLDLPAYRAELAQAWQGALKGVRRLGLPAIVGLRFAPEAVRDLSEKLGVEIFEIPILPPSVPGMRLYTVLRNVIQNARGSVVLGPHVTGWVEDGRVLGVASETENGSRNYAAPKVILATGGFRHGGLEAPARGEVKESVFGLPVAKADDWFAPLYWGPHPYARFGVRVNAQMQPVDPQGAVIYPNVWATGGLLAGADRNGEGSREGIDLATAWQAVSGRPN